MQNGLNYYQMCTVDEGESGLSKSISLKLQSEIDDLYWCVNIYLINRLATQVSFGH